MTFDVISFGLGSLFGGFSFLLKYRPRWRNFLTREFVATLSQGIHRTHDADFKTLELIIEVKSAHAEEVQLIDLYLKFSKKGYGLGPHGQFIKGRDYRAIEGYLWRSFQDEKPLIVNKFLVIPFDVQRKLLDQINARTITYLSVVARSNKYGTISSSDLKIKYPMT